MRCSESQSRQRQGGVAFRASLGLGLALVLALGSGATAASYEHVTIAGTPAIDPDTVRRALALPCLPESLESHLRRVARLYYDQGYLEAMLRPESGASDTLRLTIEAGHLTPLAQVLVRGSQALPETRVREILALEPGMPFRSAEVEARLDILTQAYARRGYLDAEVTLERLDIAAAGVTLGIAISEGERCILDEVVVRGNTLTRAALVQKLAGLGTPQPADASRIREAPQLLLRSGLFDAVDVPVLYRLDGSDRIGVVLPVVESERRHSIFGVLGMARDPVRNRAYLTGAVDLAVRNIYGTGRDAAFAWRRDARTGSRLALGYHERLLFGSALDLTLGLSQTVRDSTSTWQTLDLGFSLPVRRNVLFDIGGAIDRSVYHIAVQGNTLRWRSRAGVRLASLGREADGGRYGDFELHGEYARRRNDLQTAGGSDQQRIGQTLAGGRFDAGLPLGARHAVATRAEWHVVETGVLPVPDSELYEFGGAQSVRGYREGQFRGDRVVFGAVEYRYGPPRGARLYGFVDAGAYARRFGNGRRDSETVLGYGAGLRAAVASGTLDLAFGIGDQDRSLAAIKLHVTLLQRF